MDVPQYFERSIPNVVDLSNVWFWVSVDSIAFNPLFWNIVTRRARFIARFFKGNSYYGCYAMEAVIQTLGVVRFLT
ncbi:Phosphatidyl-N-methylethanolamine N-methyltransferase [Mortierella sp. GBA35]|nr:Phosphatidyl-N-methylethanolamine N-methyltransferase [Mortierella sp. GBA35]